MEMLSEILAYGIVLRDGLYNSKVLNKFLWETKGCLKKKVNDNLGDLSLASTPLINLENMDEDCKQKRHELTPQSDAPLT